MQLGEREQVIENMSLEDIVNKGFFERVKKVFPDAIFFGIVCDAKPKERKRSNIFAHSHKGRDDYEKRRITLMTFEQEEVESSIISILKEMAEG